MTDRRYLLDRFSSAVDMQDEAIPVLPLIEIVGNRRVLIEHHCGVTEYGCGEIRIKVKHGQIAVYGNNLELVRMTKEQLIICGSIEGIKLLGRGK